MGALSWLGFSAGVVMVLGTVASVTASLVVPRGLRSRLAVVVSRCIGRVFRMLAERRPDYEDRDRLLSLQGPVVILGMIAAWVTLIYLGFALLLWPFAGSLGTGLVIAGSSMFTLGFASIPGAAPTALTFLAAAFGLIVVALQIAYLPTMYAAFNRREQLVTMLESRGGVPSWGPEILARHELIDNVASLGGLYTQWEQWAADLAETHTTYQVLIWFRSPHPLRSWITALLSVLDAGALQLALNPLTAPPEARPFMRMGYMALREVANVMQIPYNPDPMPEDAVSITREDFDEALEHMTSVGWRPERDADQAWIHFRGWRVTYEAIAYAVADRVDAPPALWSGPRHAFGAGTLAPARPPHRSPSAERDQVLKITAARRQSRPVSISGRRRDGRDGNGNANGDDGAGRLARLQKLPADLRSHAARPTPQEDARAQVADAAAEEPPD